MKINKLDFSVAILAIFTVFLLPLKIPVWALFIGWTWYFAMGANPTAFKKAIPALFVGYILAAVSIIVFAASGFNIYALAGAVGITVFILMLSLKISVFSSSLASFNAYSCMFAGYYAGNFPKIEAGGTLDINNIVICILWIALANFLGLICGLISVWIGSLGAKS